MGVRALRGLQHLLLVVGIVLLAAYASAVIDGTISSRLALSAFDRAQAAGSAADERPAASPQGREQIDFSLWAEKRIRAYRNSLVLEKRAPWAVLSVGRLGVRAPVLDGTDDLALNRGVGWISGTARPGESGNIGIAGHRDGFFRGLKDVAVGDVVTLTTLGEQTSYVVDEIRIVRPEDVEVLEPRASPSLTLVTCYPFYFVGDAPSRFIVHASLDRKASTSHAERPAVSR